MAFEWTEKRMQWYLDASRYSNFHRRMADIVRPHLGTGDCLCDFGCGLGQLDLLLAPFVRHITCVDIDAAVLARLYRQAAAAGISNIKTLCANAQTTHGMFDVGIMAFFGQPPQLMFDCLRKTSRALIRVANARPGGTALQPGKYNKKRETVDDISAALCAAGHSYKLVVERAEFGQPLQTIEEARAFMRCNNPAMRAPELDAFLSKHLVEVQRDGFRYFLPGEKEFGVFIIDSCCWTSKM